MEGERGAFSVTLLSTEQSAQGRTSEMHESLSTLLREPPIPYVSAVYVIRNLSNVT